MFKANVEVTCFLLTKDHIEVYDTTRSTWTTPDSSSSLSWSWLNRAGKLRSTGSTCKVRGGMHYQWNSERGRSWCAMSTWRVRWY